MTTNNDIKEKYSEWFTTDFGEIVEAIAGGAIALSLEEARAEGFREGQQAENKNKEIAELFIGTIFRFNLFAGLDKEAEAYTKANLKKIYSDKDIEESIREAYIAGATRKWRVVI
jgi:hypothetical protein